MASIEYPSALADRLARYEAHRAEPPDGTTRAAVILLLRPGNGEAEVLFVVRASHEGDPWSGHVALPGGRWEPGDADLEETALRELHEETGLELGRQHLLGRLDELHPVSRHIPRIAITPFVGWREALPRVRRTVEIDGHFWVPVSELRTPARRGTLDFRRDGEDFSFPTIEYGGHAVWGLTFSIVRNFLDLSESP